MIKIAHKLISDKGQTLVETAFALFLFFLLVLGIFEFGRAMYSKNTLTNAARAGARAAVVQSSPALALGTTGSYCSFTANDPCTSSSYSSTCINICNSLLSGIPKNAVTVSMTVTQAPGNSGSSVQTGDIVQVQVAWPTFAPIVTPLFSGIIGATHPLTANAAMRYE